MTGLMDKFNPGQPISAVPASWFNAVAHFLNNLIGTMGIKVSRDAEPPQIGLNVEEAKKLLGVPGNNAGTPADHTEPSAADGGPNVYDQNGDDWNWSVGGSNGLKLDCYCKIKPGGNTQSVFQRCQMTFSKDGILIRAELLPGRVVLVSRNLAPVN